VVRGHESLSKAMDHRHPMLRRLFDTGADKTRWNSHDDVAQIATKATTPKAAVMTVLGAVVAAWEESTGRHTWRNPTAWDTRVLGALIEWGYQPSDVERLLVDDTEPQGDDTSDT